MLRRFLLMPGTAVGALGVLAGTAAALAPETALALGNDTVFLRGNASLSYDSNVFRLADEFDAAPRLGTAQTSDMYYGLGGGIRVDLPLSRQRLRADASATRYKYSQFRQLDYTGYALRGIWDWRAGDDWHGTLSAGGRQARQSYSSQVGFFVPSLVKIYDGLADIRYALTSRWELQAAAGTSRTRFNDRVRQIDDFELSSASVGASYRTRLGNSTGARLRYERGDWPNRPPAPSAFFDNEYTQYTLSALVDWALTGKSRLHGDVGYTWRDREAVVEREFDGLSGRLTYDYAFTGKSTVHGSVYQLRGPYEDLTATYIKTTGIDLGYVYEIGSKTVARADASYRELEYLGSTLVVLDQQREDELTTLGVGVTYQATRVLSLSTGVRYAKRASNIPFGDYDAYTVYINGGVEF